MQWVAGLVVALALVSPGMALETVTRDRRVPQDTAILINNHFLFRRSTCDDSGELPPLHVMTPPANGTLCFKIQIKPMPGVLDYYDGIPARRVPAPDCSGKTARSKVVYYIPNRAFRGPDAATYIESKHKIVYDFRLRVVQTAFHPDESVPIDDFRESDRLSRGDLIPECQELVS